MNARRAGVRPEIWLVLASVGGSLLVYLPFLSDMAPVYRFWDGPNFVTVARTLYDIRPENPLLAYAHTPRFFAAYLPAQPLLLRCLAFVGYEPALLLASILASAVAAVLFYRLARDVWKLSSPFFLALVFLFLPPRWLLYRSVGATEPLYIAATFGSILLFERARFGRASAAAALAALTRISGLMIAPAYAVVLVREKRFKAILWLALVPAGLTAFFLFCAVRFGDFFAYFTPHGEKLERMAPFGFLPVLFQKGLYHQVEFHILLALVYAIGISRLRSFPVIFWYCVFELALHLCLSTEDWSRYLLSMAPFALVVGYRDVIDTRFFRWILPVFVALSVYYAWGVIPLNGCRPDIYEALRAYLGIAPPAVVP